MSFCCCPTPLPRPLSGDGHLLLRQRRCITTPRAGGIPFSPGPSRCRDDLFLPLRRREAVASTVAALLFPHLLPFADPFTLALEEGNRGTECSLSVTPSGLAFCDIVVGAGAVASKGQLVKAHYVGRLENGKVFDSSYGRGRPLTFRIGVGEVIKGWDKGILGDEGIPPMLFGGKRTLRVPPELGYGMRGAGCRGGSCIIPPDSTLLFDVELLG